MVDIKQTSFLLLIILVSISGVYEFAKADAVVGQEIEIGTMTAFSSSTLLDNISSIEDSIEEVRNSITNFQLTDPTAILRALFKLVVDGLLVLFRVLFGWVDLISGVFTAVGLANLELVFVPPIAMIELFGIFYFLRDFVNTVRGVAGQ